MGPVEHSALVVPLVLTVCDDLVASGFRPSDRLLRRSLPPLYAASTLALGLALTSDWMISGVVKTSWGWGYQLGPGFLAFYLVTIGVVGIAARLVLRDFRDHRSPAERRQGPWVALGIALPLTGSTMTDVVLPAGLAGLEGIVFKNENAFKQRLRAADVAPGLHLE